MLQLKARHEQELGELRGLLDSRGAQCEALALQISQLGQDLKDAQFVSGCLLQSRAEMCRDCMGSFCPTDGPLPCLIDTSPSSLC